MKVGKEEIAGLLMAVEMFMEQDEEAVIQDWEQRCHTIAAAVQKVEGIKTEYQPPYANRFPPASPLLHIHFSSTAPLPAPAVQKALEEGEPSIVVGSSPTSLTFGPQTLQEGEAETIARRLRFILQRA